MCVYYTFPHFLIKQMPKNGTNLPCQVVAFSSCLELWIGQCLPFEMEHGNGTEHAGKALL